MKKNPLQKRSRIILSTLVVIVLFANYFFFQDLHDTSFGTTKTSLSPANYSIYREKFVFNTSSSSVNFDLVSGAMYIYNASASISGNSSAVLTNWDPVKFDFQRSGSALIKVTFLVYIWRYTQRNWAKLRGELANNNFRKLDPLSLCHFCRREAPNSTDHTLLHLSGQRRC